MTRKVQTTREYIRGDVLAIGATTASAGANGLGALVGLNEAYSAAASSVVNPLMDTVSNNAPTVWFALAAFSLTSMVASSCGAYVLYRHLQDRLADNPALYLTM